MRTAAVNEGRIVAALLDGDVAIIPTDTLYGLAGRPGSDAIGVIFELKGRPRDKPLPICGASTEQLGAVAAFDERASALAAAFWPGPLTLVLARAPGFDHDLGGNVGSVAVRVPDRAATLRVLGRTGPLAVTSANLSGRQPSADAASAVRAFPGIPILDDGPADGTGSTVVSLLDGFEILRPGPLSLDQILRS